LILNQTETTFPGTDLKMIFKITANLNWRRSGVLNIRITYVDKETRQSTTNWSDSDTIRFSAYRNDKDNLLHKGAEIPIKSKDEIINLIEALCMLYKQKSKKWKNYY
jgi:hypothetical protein